MRNLSLQLFAAAVVAPTLLALIVATAAVPGDGAVKPQQLVYLGRVGTKTYFLENTSAMTWAQGSTYCKSTNMELGTVESTEERTFLVGAIRQIIGGTVWAWTDGIEKTQTTRFVWSSTQTDALNITTTVDRPTYCLRLEVDTDVDELSEYACGGSMATLCQTLD